MRSTTESSAGPGRRDRPGRADRRVRRRWCAASHGGRGPRPTPAAARRSRGDRAGAGAPRRCTSKRWARAGRAATVAAGRTTAGLRGEDRRRSPVGQVPGQVPGRPGQFHRQVPVRTRSRSDSRPRKAPAFVPPHDGIGREPQRPHAGQEGRERQLGLEPRERRAEAVVAGPAEGEVAVVRPADVEPIGVREPLGVAVGRGHHRDDRLPLADRPAAELAVRRGEPGGVLDRALEAEELLDGRWDEPGLAAQELPLVGVSQQREHPVGDQVRRRLQPADHRDDRVGDDLVLGQPVAVRPRRS